MPTLIIKLNATGDVVRTTTLLNQYSGVTWITAAPNHELLQHCAKLRCVNWTDRERALDRNYDLGINLEDEVPTAQFARQVGHKRLFGAYLSDDGTVVYTDDSHQWFDLSLISVHGRQRADHLKLLNRRTYQELIFEGLAVRAPAARTACWRSTLRWV